MPVHISKKNQENNNKKIKNKQTKGKKEKAPTHQVLKYTKGFQP